MADISSASWSETASSNNAATPDGFPEGMAFSAVNDAAREMMGAVKREWNRSHPTVSSGGTSSAITLTYTTAPTYVTGIQFAFKVTTTNAAAATLNVNSLGAKKVYSMTYSGPQLVAPGEMAAGNVVVVTYDAALDSAAGGFFLWTTVGTGPVLLARTTTAGSQSVIDFTLPSGFDVFHVKFRNIQPSTGTPAMLMRLSTDGGTNFLLGGSDYAYGTTVNSASAPLAFNVTGASFVSIADSIGTGNNGASGQIDIYNAADASLSTQYEASATPVRSGVAWQRQLAGGATAAAATHNAMRLFLSSGVFANGGVVSLYGYR